MNLRNLKEYILQIYKVKVSWNKDIDKQMTCFNSIK